ncbi:methyl-accepting chemotaxis protein [Shewanella psychrotolerans]|uniref:methyl-accepting chemotaxis protein n=1 Tax=Shewanella psychrotolerans TaxID=2864206 RepID=UPI001C65831F|nr:methyl-accepting chemotaxis protein [Shewanella psychrotolerans]QYK02196.1 methyl-accepting chemotaxis protein [Shewanella psychrotolerans]
MHNWSVKNKLSVGFGVVILLTILLGGVSLFSLDRIQTTVENQKVVDDFSAYITLAGQARREYLKDFDSQTAAKVVSSLKAASLMTQNELRVGADENSLALLQELKGYIDRYLDIFTNIDNATKRLRQTENSLVASINTSSEMLSELKKYFTGRNIDSELQLSLANLETQFYVSRYSVLSMMLGNSKEDRVRSAVAELENQLANVQTQMTNQQEVELVNGVKESFNSYLDKVFSVVKIKEEQHNFGEKLVGEASNIVKDSKKIRLFQDEERETATYRAYFVVLVTMIIAIVAGISATIFINNGIVPPLKSVLEIAQNISDGNLTSDIYVDRKDELGLLQSAIKTMNTNLRDVITKVKGSSLQLATSASELSAVTEQTSMSARNQKDQTDQVATAMNEMTVTVAEVARNTETAADAVQQADKNVAEASAKIVTVISKVEELSAKMTQSSAAMESMVSSSDQIGSIMDVIKGIAEQTNLLALNAAIEAARAGESGRGFAVVADEVRGLAQRTHDSTSEIEQIIGKLQSSAGQAAVEVGDSFNATNELVDLIGQINSSLITIADLTRHIRDMDEQIATAAEEQTTVAEDINRNIISVRDEAEQAFAANEQTALASGQLAQLGNELQDVVSQFKV